MVGTNDIKESFGIASTSSCSAISMYSGIKNEIYLSASQLSNLSKHFTSQILFDNPFSVFIGEER